jgi:hypothetical protein
MPHRIRYYAVFAGFCVCTAAPAAVTTIAPGDFLPSPGVITFETGSTGLPSVPGVSLLNTGQFGASASFYNGFFGNQVMANLVGTTFTDLGAVFASPVQAVGAWMGKIPNFLNTHAPAVTVKIYDASTTLLYENSVVLPNVGTTPVFFGARSTTPIARIEWLGNDTGFFAVDNVTYGNAVPEPAALLLLAPLLALRRRR